jgi:hypothetical protein
MKELGLPMTAVEIGVAEGYNSADLLAGGIEKLFMVDIWKTENVQGDGASDQEWHDKNYRAALFRVKQYGDRAVILKGFSEAMSIHVPDNSLGLVYLDGGHSYADVYLDLITWINKAVDGAIIAGHDYSTKAYGVARAVQEFASNYGYQVHLIPEDKEEDAGFYFLKK